MLDLNHILLFIAIASPLVLLWRLRQLRSAAQPGWASAAILVLVGAGITWLLAPSIAGYVGGTFWALLLLAPSMVERRIAGLLLAKQYQAARRFALVRQALHPWNDSPHLPWLLRALELAQAGNLSAALEQLAGRRSETTAAGRTATAFTFALTENWAGLVEWCRRDLSVTRLPAVRTLYLRGLGEVGALDHLAWDLATRSQNPEQGLATSPQFAQELLYLFAFAGRIGAVVRLSDGPLARLPHGHQQFWIGTAELAAGKTAAALERLARLRGKTEDAILERALERRLAQAPDFPRPQLSATSERVLARLTAEMSAAPIASAKRGAPAVWILILLNVAMFGAEIALGGATNVLTLHRLGALEPAAVILQHQYWRLLTALFLHYGLLHIAVNLYALYLIGPALERMIGSVKFAAGYLLAGLGSGVWVVFLKAVHLTKATQLVGASGCVMGIIGISAGLILRHRLSPLVGQRLRYILVIVVVQTLFDLWTPQVSVAAHLGGFLSGVLIGIVFAARPAT